MIILKYTKTHENCPKGCLGISYSHDNYEHKTCIECQCIWNKIENTIIQDSSIKKQL